MKIKNAKVSSTQRRENKYEKKSVIGSPTVPSLFPLIPRREINLARQIIPKISRGMPFVR